MKQEFVMSSMVISVITKHLLQACTKRLKVHKLDTESTLR